MILRLGTRLVPTTIHQYYQVQEEIIMGRKELDAILAKIDAEAEERRRKEYEARFKKDKGEDERHPH